MASFVDPASLPDGHPANRRMTVFPHYCFLYVPVSPAYPPEAEYAFLWTHVGDEGKDDRLLAEAVNAVVAKYYDGAIPFTMTIDAVTQEVRAVLLKDTPLPVLVYHRYDDRVGTLVRKGDALTLPYDMDALPLDKMPSSVFAPADVVVAHVRVTVLPKPHKEAAEAEPLEGADIRAPPLEFEETVVLPAGTYTSVAEVAEALNTSIKRRGRRDGHVLFQQARKKVGVLRLAARTRKNARPGHRATWTIETTPTEAGFLLGLVAPATVGLGSGSQNKLFIDFHGLPSGLIM